MKSLVHKERETKTLTVEWGRTTSSPSSVAFVMECSVLLVYTKCVLPAKVALRASRTPNTTKIHLIN